VSGFGVVLKSLPRIERLDLAVITLPDWHPEATNQPTAPVYGYVIVHPDGPIVFDTGVGFGNDFIDEVYEPECFGSTRPWAPSESILRRSSA
jgi:hypothetical protein